jgi:hypothetical protein
MEVRMLKTFAILILLVSCGQESTIYLINSTPKDGSSCSVERIANGSRISCTNGTSSTVYDGINGSSCTVLENSNGAQINCGDSSAQINHGEDGLNGDAGVSCTVERVADGAYLRCGQNSVFVADGTNSTGIEIQELCKDITGKTFTEVAIRFPDGRLVAYAAWGEGFLTVLEPKTYYRTSDGYSCNFYVDLNNKIVY